jgi:hypothetical protein
MNSVEDVRGSRHSELFFTWCLDIVEGTTSAVASMAVQDDLTMSLYTPFITLASTSPCALATHVNYLLPARALIFRILRL